MFKKIRNIYIYFSKQLELANGNNLTAVYFNRINQISVII